MTEREALKLALNALEIGLTLIEDFGSTEQLNAQYKAITAIYEALAEPEPVAWAKFSAKGNIIDLLSEPDDDYTPLYTTPPQRTWVGLTLDERIELAQDVDWAIGAYCEYAEKIEAKLRSKNSG